MTNIIFTYNNNKEILSIKISGHSSYAEKNSDIICSSISSIVNFVNIFLHNIHNINIITKIDSKIPLILFKIPSYLNKKSFNKVQEVFMTMKIYFESMSHIYFKYIKIKEEVEIC